MRENYLKLYENLEATLYNRIDPLNGMVLTTTLGYGEQRMVDNNSLFSFFYSTAAEEKFTPNLPEGRSALASELQDHKRLLAAVELEYAPRRPFIIRNGRKNYRKSPWPTFTLGYRQALPLEDAGWSQFSRLEFKVRHSFDVGLLSQMDWSVEAGLFPDTTSLHFSDYRHFKSSPLYIDMAGFEGAQVFMPYYMGSTNKYWVKVNTTFTTSYLLVKYLPWFSERPFH